MGDYCTDYKFRPENAFAQQESIKYMVDTHNIIGHDYNKNCNLIGSQQVHLNPYTISDNTYLHVYKFIA